MRVALSQLSGDTRRRPLGQAHSHWEPASTGDENMLEAPRGGVTHPAPTPDFAKSLLSRWGVYILRMSPAEKCQDSHQLSQGSDSWGQS